MNHNHKFIAISNKKQNNRQNKPINKYKKTVCLMMIKFLINRNDNYLFIIYLNYNYIT